MAIPTLGGIQQASGKNYISSLTSVAFAKTEASSGFDEHQTAYGHGVHGLADNFLKKDGRGCRIRGGYSVHICAFQSPLKLCENFATALLPGVVMHVCLLWKV